MQNKPIGEVEKNTAKRPRSFNEGTMLAELRFPAGPREKIVETRTLEIVIKLLISGHAHEFQVDQELNEVLLVFAEDKDHPINITNLLRSADLGHVEFSHRELDQYLAFIRHHFNGLLDFLNEKLSKKATLPEYYQKLHAGELAAIIMYTDQYHLNELVNGKFTPAELARHARFLPLMVTTLGILGQANRELTVLTSGTNIIHTESNKPVYRRDDLSWIEYHSNIFFFQNRGFTSTTQIQENFTKGTIVNPPAFAPNFNSISMHGYEHEVLVDPTELVYSIADDNTFFGRIVNTPKRKPLTYLMTLALRFAFTHILSFTYKDFNGDRQKENTILTRQNHGLAHTTRKVFYVDPIIEYLSSHTKDPHLIEFCNSITLEQRELIKLVLVFSVTGRECEIGYSSCPKLYKTYKINSAKWFEKFARSHHFSNDMISRGMHIIEHLCDPNFASHHKADNYLHFIASMAHDIDAPRTLNRKDFDSNMQRYHASIPPSTAQKTHWQYLLNYVIECILITGDRVLPGYTDDGKYVNERRELQLKAGTNPLFCERILEQVPTPDIKKVLASAHIHKVAKIEAALTDNELIDAIQKMILL